MVDDPKKAENTEGGAPGTAETKAQAEAKAQAAKVPTNERRNTAVVAADLDIVSAQEPVVKAARR